DFRVHAPCRQEGAVGVPGGRPQPGVRLQLGDELALGWVVDSDFVAGAAGNRQPAAVRMKGQPRQPKAHAPALYLLAPGRLVQRDGPVGLGQREVLAVRAERYSRNGEGRLKDLLFTPP